MRTTRWPRWTAIFGLCLVLAAPCLADVKLHALFSDNMVLQSDMKVPVWGKAEPGEAVTVAIGDQKETATAGTKGHWKVELMPLKAGGPFIMTVTGKNSISLQNVLVGEVWVCSGQSNMQTKVSSAANAGTEIAEAKYPQIRLFTVSMRVSDTPQENVKGKWVECSPETVAGFSAVAYFFGRDIHKSLGVPVGLIHTSWGGTPAQSWTSRGALESDPDLKAYLDSWAKVIENYPQKLDEYKNALEKWTAATQAAQPTTQPARRPSAPAGPGSPNQPSGLYNAMIAPLVPYAIRGAIWYQGESNAGQAYLYRKLFPAMITDWRRAWGEGDFPFLFVQLANFQARMDQPSESSWAELREAQLMTLKLPKTAMAVIIDIGDAKDIHPKNKQDVGHRLALGARAAAYGQDLVYSGPVYDSMTIEGDKIRLSFKHVGGGLAAKGGETLKGFAVAGKDRKFVWADARIDGQTVIVSSPSVPQPVAARYAWANNPECNLYNRENLPATPFQTDDWPGVTAPKTAPQ